MAEDVHGERNEGKVEVQRAISENEGKSRKELRQNKEVKEE